MKTTPLLGCAFAALACASFPASATVYSDASGDIGVGSGLGILDITSVEVSNDASRLTFKINLAGDPVATDWGKYMIGIDSVAGGDTSGNGWGRPIGMSSGMDFFVGAWADWGSGAEIRKWGGAAWNLQSTTSSPNPDVVSISKDSSSVTLSFNYAGLGLAPGNSFLFDVYTSGGGGGDSAIDALGNPAATVSNWGDLYNSGQFVNSFTVQAVPEPALGSLLVLGGCLAWMRRSSRRSA